MEKSFDFNNNSEFLAIRVWVLFGTTRAADAEGPVLIQVPELIFCGGFTSCQFSWSEESSTRPFVDKISKSSAYRKIGNVKVNNKPNKMFLYMW